jgi:hypothetical protein
LPSGKPFIIYSFNITGEFGVRRLTGITNGNGITTTNIDKKIFDSNDFKNFYGRINSATATKELESMLTFVRCECLKHLK